MVLKVLTSTCSQYMYSYLRRMENVIFTLFVLYSCFQTTKMYQQLSHSRYNPSPYHEPRAGRTAFPPPQYPRPTRTHTTRYTPPPLITFGPGDLVKQQADLQKQEANNRKQALDNKHLPISVFDTAATTVDKKTDLKAGLKMPGFSCGKSTCYYIIVLCVILGIATLAVAPAMYMHWKKIKLQRSGFKSHQRPGSPLEVVSLSLFLFFSIYW
jgi:hypothetical protein